ncbi:MAG: hypothetical protein KC431_30170, partial [Myxococcales bacterium]|nr:hypothetical protein [Myxococcales bacterium]
MQRDAALASLTEQGARWLDPAAAARWRRVVLSMLQPDEGERLREQTRLSGQLALAEARVSLAAGEYAHARELLAAAQAAFEAELEPGDPLALEQWLALVQLELAVGDPAAARVAGSRVVALAEAHHHGSLLQMAALLAQAQALRADGDLAQAMALTMQATRISTPGHSHRHDRRRGEALILGARIAAENGDDDDAQALLTRAEAYLYDGPERALPRLWRGVIELRRRRIPEGLAAIEDGLAIVGELDPEDARALPMLELAGRALLEADQLDSARTVLRAAVDLADRRLGMGPRQAFLLRDLGELEQRAKHPTLALDHFDRAHVMSAAALGIHHPEVVSATLARADLAWDLDQRDYAAGLYRVLV